MTPLPRPRNPEECHLYVAERCHLYIATTSPHLIDLILLFTVLEGFILARWRKISVRTVIVMLLPGLCLLLALRAAMAGAAWPWVPVVLTGALLSHFFDMRERFRRR